MTEFPLLFTFRDVIAGQNFLAGVRVEGRALMVCEGEDLPGWVPIEEMRAPSANIEDADEKVSSFQTNEAK